MPPSPNLVVLRPDGRRAAALFDLSHQGKVALQIEDDGLARLLSGHGIVPPRPSLLDASSGGAHGAHTPRPQRNWFLAPPLAGVRAALEKLLTPEEYRITEV